MTKGTMSHVQSSEDLDQTAHAQSDLSLHCLPHISMDSCKLAKKKLRRDCTKRMLMRFSPFADDLRYLFSINVIN